MKVLMVLHDEPGYQLSKALTERNVEVSILLPRGRGSGFEDIPLIPINYPNPFYFTWFMYRLRKISQEFDVVHVHHLKGHGFLAALCIPVLKPLVSTAYADDVFGRRFVPPVRALFTVSRSDAIIFQTESMQKRFNVPEYGVIPNGIPRNYAPRMSKKRAKDELGLGSNFLVVYPKLEPGLTNLLKSLPNLPGLKVALPEILKEVELDADISPIFYNQKDLSSFMRAADVCVIPSIDGHSYLEALEAMACGTAVVANYVGLLPEIVGDAGILLPSGHTNAMKDVIVKLHDSPKLVKRYSTLGLIRSKDFHWHKIARKTSSIYNKLLSEK